jgi:hypothetical protein
MFNKFIIVEVLIALIINFNDIFNSSLLVFLIINIHFTNFYIEIVEKP